MKKFVTILSPLALVLLSGVPQANASVLGSIVSGVGSIVNGAFGLFTKPLDLIVSGAALLISLIFGAIGWLLFNLGAALISFSISVNSLIASSPVVTTGYASTLSLTNLIFVVAIIVVAFATILRRENYAMKKILPRLIIIALLINFSLPIATTIIGVSNSVTDSLMSQGGLNITALTGFWQNSFSSLSDVFASTAIDNANSLAVNIASSLFSILFVLIGAFTLIAIAVMLLVRYVTLSLLLVLMPIAVALLIFPALEIPGGHPWKAWQGQFIRWVLFGPVTVFFIVLAVQIVNNLPSHQVGGSVPAGFATIGDMVTVIGLLLGGVFVANKLSITGASTFDAGMNWTFGKAGEFARQRQSKLETEIRGQKLAGKEPTAAKKLQLNLYKGAASGIETGQKAILGTVGGKAEIAKTEKVDKAEVAESKRRFVLSNVESDNRILFRLDNSDLSEIAKNGKYEDQQKINKAWSELNETRDKLTPVEQARLDTLHKQITNSTVRGEWVKEKEEDNTEKGETKV